MQKDKEGLEDKKDRLLGSEWKNWKGQVEKSDATVGLFLLMSFFVMAIFTMILFFGNYLIYPRLEGIHPILPLFVQTIILGIVVLMAVWIVLLTASIFFNIDLMFGLDKKIMGLLNLESRTQRLAARFGINRDRIGNSFIKLNNKITRLRKHVFKPCDVLVLLPRCLTGNILKKTMEITKKYNIASYVLHGGEAARAKIKKHNPKAIIAVACERDLVAGIKDVPMTIMVHGIPNSRPNGPCKNTCINTAEFENTIRMFLGMRPLDVPVDQV